MTQPDDEFDEFDITEDEFDRMMAAGSPVTVVGSRGTYATGSTVVVDWPPTPEADRPSTP